MNDTPVPGIAALRAICHAGKLRRDRRPVTRATRAVSIYLTWLLLHARWSPNQVTAVALILGCAGCVLLAMPGPASLAGAGLVLAYQLLDKVDGDIARFRGRYSIRGVYLDEVGHGLTWAGIFLGPALHLALASGDATARTVFLLAGGIGAAAGVLGRAHRGAGFQLFAQYALPQPELIPADPGPAGAWSDLTREAVHAGRAGAGAGGGLAALRDLALQLGDFTVLALAVFGAAVFEAVTGSGRALAWVLFAGASVHVLLLAALVVVNLRAGVAAEVRRLDAEARARYRGEP